MATKTETTADRELVISRLINAPRELVFDVWTDPEHIKNWWGPDGFTNTISKMDVRPGGSWEFVMHGPDGTDYKNHSIFNEIVRPSLISYTHLTGPKFKATITLEARKKKTFLTMKMVFETSAEKENTVKVFKADEGLKQNMNKLENYLESHLRAQLKS